MTRDTPTMSVSKPNGHAIRHDATMRAPVRPPHRRSLLTWDRTPLAAVFEASASRRSDAG
jgi:hypothetical protein